VELNSLLDGLKLSEAESSVMKGGWKQKGGGLTEQIQAVGKLFSEKPGNAEGIVNAVGNIWCPRKGIKCKELGDNLFLFTFLQPAGKRRAIEDGPWEFGGDLLIVRDFEDCCLLEDLEFVYTPMWVRVLRLPIGLMTTATGEVIGDRIGSTIEVDTDEGGSAVGKFLRIKVRFDIRKPLLRGVTMEVDQNGKTQWCPLQYEFLPNFCYGCGLLGHVERDCPTGGWKGNKKPFGPELRVRPSRCRGMNDSRSHSLKSSGSWGQKSEGNSIMPGKLSRSSGSDLRSERARKSDEEPGDGSFCPAKSIQSPKAAVMAKNLFWKEAGRRGSGEKEGVHDVGVRENEGIERLLTEDNKTEFKEKKAEVQPVFGEMNGNMGDAKQAEVQLDNKIDNISGMELDDVPNYVPTYESIVHSALSKLGTDGEKGEMVADGKQVHDEQLLKSFRRQCGAGKDKSGDQVSAKDSSPSHDRKRGWQDEDDGVEGRKKVRTRLMWSDEEGDVVEVEMDMIDEKAGLPEQPRLAK
jgi:hypothetical protein